MKRLHRLFIVTALVLAGSLTVPSSTASAQGTQPRFGVGFNAMVTTANRLLGLGFRGRVSAPVNSDLSFAADLGLTGFFLEGRDEASYVFDPQVSAIVTLPSRGSRAPYLIGGLGAFINFEDGNDDGGPTLHGGIGWVQALNETTIFYEINPALIIGENAVDLALPFRVGVIF